MRSIQHITCSTTDRGFFFCCFFYSLFSLGCLFFPHNVDASLFAPRLPGLLIAPDKRGFPNQPRNLYTFESAYLKVVEFPRRCDCQSFSVVHGDSASVSHRRQTTFFMRHRGWRKSRDYSLTCRTREDQNRSADMLYFSSTELWTYTLREVTSRLFTSHWCTHIHMTHQY